MILEAGEKTLAARCGGREVEMKIAQRISRLGTETAFEVLAEVNRLKAEGRDIVSFSIGEPDFDTPAHIKEAAKQALDEN